MFGRGLKVKWEKRKRGMKWEEGLEAQWKLLEEEEEIEMMKKEGEIRMVTGWGCGGGREKATASIPYSLPGVNLIKQNVPKKTWTLWLPFWS